MDPESILGAHLLKLVSRMKFVRLMLPFRINLLNYFQEGYKTLLRDPLTLVYKTNLRAKPCHNFFIYVRKQIWLQQVDYNQTLQIFHKLLQVADLHKSQIDENQIDLDLIVPPPIESCKFYWRLFFQKFSQK